MTLSELHDLNRDVTYSQIGVFAEVARKSMNTQECSSVGACGTSEYGQWVGLLTHLGVVLKMSQVFLEHTDERLVVSMLFDIICIVVIVSSDCNKSTVHYMCN